MLDSRIKDFIASWKAGYGAIAVCKLTYRKKPCLIVYESYGAPQCHADEHVVATFPNDDAVKRFAEFMNRATGNFD